MKALGLLALLAILPVSVVGRSPTASGGGTSSSDGSVARKENGLRAEVRLEERLRESRNRLRRIRRKLRRAREDGNENLARRLREKLQGAKADRRRRRAELLDAMERGEVSPRYRGLKRKIREDLNAVRRARYALRRAVRRSDNRAAVKAQKKLRRSKRRLKRRRQMLRRVIRVRRPQEL